MEENEIYRIIFKNKVKAELSEFPVCVLGKEVKGVGGQGVKSTGRARQVREQEDT